MAERKGPLKTILGNVRNLNELIAYAEDSIVSKTLIDKDPGTVTLFAFDAEQSLSEHTAPYDALVQVLDGEGIFIIDGNKHLVKSGEVLIMPANIPHSVKAQKPFKMLLTMIRA